MRTCVRDCVSVSQPETVGECVRACVRDCVSVSQPETVGECVPA